MPDAQTLLLLDVDTGIDDALGLLYACAMPQATILGVSTVAGNVNLRRATRNTRAVLALAGRSETQARDVFDLDLLLRRDPPAPGALDTAVLAAAVDRAMQLPYAAFRDQVLPFLESEAVELYEGEEAWVRMQTFVAERLETAK